MKKFVFMVLAGSMLAACGTKELSREEALAAIKIGFNYPHPVDYEVYCSDPVHARRLLSSGLEQSGYVRIQRTQKLKDVGNPIVHFTEKSASYLLPVTDKDGVFIVQRVKIADEELKEINHIEGTGSDELKLVEYSTVYKNITPFAVLFQKNMNSAQVHRAYFVLTDEGWRLQKRR